MGEQNSATPYIAIKGADGELQKLTELAELPDFTENYNAVPVDGELGEGITHSLSPTDIEGKFTFTLKYPKVMRCKSRKRYVKLLMSRGYDRDTANLMVKAYKLLYMRCEETFGYERLWKEQFWTLPRRRKVQNDVP